MFQPARWWWGLFPLALLWVVAVWQKSGPIADQLARGAEASALAAAGATPGLAPFRAAVVGRDVSIAGDLADMGLQPSALKAAEAFSGVRRVEGAFRPAQPQRPYGWSVERAGNTVTLSGFVPDDATRAATLAAAARSVGAGRAAC
ncbi:MAG: hypothetical protein HEQ16_08810 [Bosea sp.]|nr:hypothetical protein [Bosea sp. (in: a-proteobacteria)]